MKDKNWTGNSNSIYKILGASNHTKEEREKNIVCSIERCDNLKRGKSDFCEKHYRRYLKYGDANKLMKAPNGDRKKHPLYSTFEAMKRRCYNKNCKEYKHYGGRGITVCDEWLGVNGFDNFLKDIGNSIPSFEKIGKRRKYTLDRIDNNGDYSKDNCKWSTMKEQCKNRREENMVYNKNRKYKPKYRESRIYKRKDYDAYSIRFDKVGVYRTAKTEEEAIMIKNKLDKEYGGFW